jgi:Ca2+-binding EF-hand superfamily protein
MTTISSGISNAAYTQRSGPPPRMHRSSEGGQQGPSLDELFSQIDTDGSGGISADELTAALQQAEGQSGSGEASSSASSSRATGSDASTNSLSAMGLSTQDFAAMLGLPPPPPPPQDAASAGISVTDASNASTTSTQDAQDMLKMLDSDGDGSVSKSEVNSFQQKMKALFESMQQMGDAQQTSGRHHHHGDEGAASSSTQTTSVSLTA